MTDEDLEPIFASDLAGEVRREFNGQVLDFGVPVPLATGDVLKTFRDLLADPHEGPVVFLALAALQYKVGQLMPFVRDAALDLIRTGEAKRAWAGSDPTLSQQRRKLLAAFEEALEAAEAIE